MSEAAKARGLKWLRLALIVGGGYEIIMGLVMIFLIQVFFPLLGAPEKINYLIFPRTAGALAVCFGALLLAAARDPARYLVIPLASIVLRLVIQLPILAGCLEVPAVLFPLLGFGAFDLVFAVLTALALKASGLDWKKW